MRKRKIDLVRRTIIDRIKPKGQFNLIVIHDKVTKKYYFWLVEEIKGEEENAIVFYGWVKDNIKDNNYHLSGYMKFCLNTSFEDFVANFNEMLLLPFSE